MAALSTITDLLYISVLQPSLLQTHQGVGSGSSQDGNACEIRGQPGGHGAAAWQGN